MNSEFSLPCYFTEVEVDGRVCYSPFCPGDEIEVIAVRQTCSDINCCEVEVVFRSAVFPETLFIGFCYWRLLGLPKQAVEWK